MSVAHRIPCSWSVHLILDFSRDRRIRFWSAQPSGVIGFARVLTVISSASTPWEGNNNARNVDMPFGIPPHTEKGRHYEGWYVGGGLTYGYQWMLSRHWNLEASIGVGYARIRPISYTGVATAARPWAPQLCRPYQRRHQHSLHILTRLSCKRHPMKFKIAIAALFGCAAFSAMPARQRCRLGNSRIHSGGRVGDKMYLSMVLNLDSLDVESNRVSSSPPFLSVPTPPTRYRSAR